MLSGCELSWGVDTEPLIGEADIVAELDIDSETLGWEGRDGWIVIDGFSEVTEGTTGAKEGKRMFEDAKDCPLSEDAEED